MPIFEYRCTKCGVIREAIVLRADDAPVECGACKGKLEKIISAPSDSSGVNSAGCGNACGSTPSECGMARGCCGGGPCSH